MGLGIHGNQEPGIFPSARDMIAGRDGGIWRMVQTEEE